MRIIPIIVRKGNVIKINVIMSPVGQGYATQEFNTLVKGITISDIYLILKKNFCIMKCTT